MDIEINKRENTYFAIKVALTLIVLVAAIAVIALLSTNSVTAISSLTVFIVYAAMIWALILFQKIYLIAYMKGNGIAVTERQFPEAFAAYRDMGKALGLRKIPQLFILQQGGALNAFAVRFSGKNYVAIYSDIFSLIATDIDAVKFVLGHELGHVKRNHMSKRFWTFPSSIIPFLTAAYSRSCEYTCDNIGDAFADNRSLGGLLVLAAGKELYKQVNMESFIEDARANNTFAVKLVGLCMSHPYLPKRIENLRAKQ